LGLCCPRANGGTKTPKNSSAIATILFIKTPGVLSAAVVGSVDVLTLQLDKNENIGLEMDRVAEPDTILRDEPIDEHGNARPQAATLIQDITPKRSIRGEVGFQNLANGIAEGGARRAGNVTVNL
jgi:hypothetical protein